jgi:ATP adenylyltransferase
MIRNAKRAEIYRQRFGVLSDGVREDIQNLFDGCRLCWALSEEGQRYVANSILFETENHVLIPALGAMIPGYVMLVAKRHCGSAATLGDAELLALQEDLGTVRKVLASKLNAAPWLVFEHGTTLTCGLKACCVDHLHLHLVPIDMHLAPEVSSRLQCDPTPAASLMDLKELRGREVDNYIFVIDSDDREYIFTPSAYSSQFVRQIIASKVGQKSSWNWIHHPMENVSVQTIRTFRRAGVAPPTIYFAHAIEGLSKDGVQRVINHARTTIARDAAEVNVLSMHELLGPALEGLETTDFDGNVFLVEAERSFLEACDIVLVDLSIPDWQYVGSLMEIVYASMADVPVIAIVGETNIGQRRWLNAHVDYCVRNIDEAATMVANVLSHAR